MRIAEKKQKNSNTKMIIGAVVGVLSAVPIVFAIKYAMDKKKVEKAYSERDKYIEKINDEIDKMPTDNEGYEEYLKNTDVDQRALNQYNESLAEVKASGKISAECIKQNGFETQQEFEDALNTAFMSGKKGDETALETFNNLYTSYQNDMFTQAQVKASEAYYDTMISEFGVENVDVSATVADVPQLDDNTLLGAFTALVAVGGALCAGYFIGKRVARKKQEEQEKYDIVDVI